MSMKKILTVIVGLCLAGTLGVQAAEVTIDVSKLPPASTKKDLSFEKHILPIFKKSCVDCHGPEKQKARLRVDTLEELKKGSRGKPVVVKGKAAKSKLLLVVARLGDPDEAMPPEGKGDPLTKEQVGLIRAWIDQGLKE
jgi:mono/diheme cytochrome c family protein